MSSRFLCRVLIKLTLYPILGLACFAKAQSNDPDYLAGKTLFLKAVPACAICHTLNDASSEGAVGPVLDEIKPSAQRVAKALRNGLGSMPSYGSKLSDSQIDALARYVSKASGGAP
jgi:mono/diheme cytochrome c family protein